MDALDAAANRFAALLEQFDAPYAIMGGLAVRLYALPRATYDADFIAIVERESLPRLYTSCENLGFVISESQKAGWGESVHGFPVIKLQWFVEHRAIDFDVFLAESPFLRAVLGRRQRAGADGWETWFVTAEDLILLKLLAGRKKGIRRAWPTSCLCRVNSTYTICRLGR